MTSSFAFEVERERAASAIQFTVLEMLKLDAEMNGGNVL